LHSKNKRKQLDYSTNSDVTNPVVRDSREDSYSST
jgi:hypothetical protein